MSAMKEEMAVMIIMKGINSTYGGLNKPSPYKKGSVARVPQVPGAFGKKPTPKKERKRISSLLSDGRLASFIT